MGAQTAILSRASTSNCFSTLTSGSAGLYGQMNEQSGKSLETRSRLYRGGSVVSRWRSLPRQGVTGVQQGILPCGRRNSMRTIIGAGALWPAEGRIYKQFAFQLKEKRSPLFREK